MSTETSSAPDFPVSHLTTDPTATAAGLLADVETQSVAGLTVVVLDTPTLGDRSYLVHDGNVAFVVDPQRDLDRVLAVLEREQVRLTHVLETHIHNDYLTGGLALAERTGAAYLVNAEDDVSYERTPVRDGEVVSVGDRMRVTALATPGHTYTHLSYALAAVPEGGGAPQQLGVFTGGSLLFGATGRPDLLGPDHTDALVRHQHASAQRLADVLPDDAQVFPTHGFGSFCSATQSDATASTIGDERRSNPVLTQDEETYVRELLDGLGAYPTYYAHMGPGNAAGPGEPDLSTPDLAEASELRRRIEAGEWVVDLRNRTAFAAGHAAGTLNFGLDGGFATYLGWLIPWGTPLTLLGETPEQVAEAQRELVRIGIDRPAAQATGGPDDWADDTLRTYPSATFADLAQVRHHREVVVLDVRRAEEHAEGHIDGALNIPLHEVWDRRHEVPSGELWVHCAGGYRASVAASIIDAAGHTVVAVDDSFDQAAAAGLPVS
ncbi:MAG: MBL fold metallo-hydrolase [Nocardioides sp.]|nr:MBL fold metallo-hydrolase [Nocardioides sp.]